MNCATCAFWLPEGSMCKILKRKVDKEYDSCPGYTSSTDIETCSFCGRKILSSSVVWHKENDEWKIYCDSCNKAMHTCTTCKRCGECDFQTNPSTIPQVIRQRVQQGNMIMETDQVNPARIEITCKKNCKCFSEEFGCMKQNFQFCITDDNWEKVNG